MDDLTVAIACENVGLVRKRADGGELRILSGLSVRFRRRRMALVTGATGAGKTSLLHLLACLRRPTSGQILFEGQPVSRWTTPHQDRWRRQVGVVFQHACLLTELTVIENVVLPLIPRVGSLSELRRKGRRALEMTGMEAAAATSVSTLSGGERQKVAVARALVGRPGVVLADEPTAHQDDQGVEIIGNALEAAMSWGAVVVVAAHDHRLASLPAVHETWKLDSGRLEAAP